MRGKRTFKYECAALILIITTALFLTGCGNRDSAVSADSSWYSEKAGISSPCADFTGDTDKQVSASQAYLIPLSLESLTEQSSLVVRGRVLGFDYLTVDPSDGGGAWVYTDYYIQVLETLRGEPSADENGLITVRADGGENYDSIQLNRDISMTTGSEYLLFLVRPIGGAYATKDDYYMVLNISIGAFVASSETSALSDGRNVPETFAPMSYTSLVEPSYTYTDLAGQIKSYGEKYPVDEDYQKKEFINSIKKNLESGFMTKEEYDLAIDSLNEYGTVLYYTEYKE